MGPDWTTNLPAAIYFVIGIGALSAALLAIIQLWRAVTSDARVSLQDDVKSIRNDLHDIRARVGMLELEIARIDQPAIVKRFDGLETKIDRLYEFLLERLTKAGV